MAASGERATEPVALHLAMCRTSPSSDNDEGWDPLPAELLGRQATTFRSRVIR